MRSVKPRRVLGYARVSSVDQSLGTSLADQERVIRQHAERCGFKEPTMYVEAESGIGEKLEKREQINALMADIREGDLVLCDKIDRWSRDIEFTHGSVRRILARGASIYFVGDACDPSTDEGDTMLGMRALFAKEEHKRIKLRLVGTRNRLRQEGYYSGGLPPLGYRRPKEIANRLQRNVLEIVPEEAELVRTIFQRYVAGASMMRLAGELNVKLDLIKDALSRRLYIGEIQGPPSRPGRRDGEWIKGRHPPIIDIDLWRRAQETIAQRRTCRMPHSGGKAETSTWMLRDVARCGLCGGKAAAAYAGPKSARRHYYRCWRQCSAKGPRGRTSYVRVDVVEEKAFDLILERLAALRHELGKPPKKRQEPVEDTAAKREALRKRRERALDLYEQADIDREALNARLAKIDLELAKIETKDEKPPPLANPKARRELLGQLRQLEYAFSAASPEERRAVVNLLVRDVGIASGKNPVFTWQDAEAVRESLDTVRDILLASLGRAPAWDDVLNALFREMVVS
jgi:site-specific DNA recombinase